MSFDKGIDFFKKGLGLENEQTSYLPHLVMIDGFCLWVATIGLSAYLVDHESGYTRDYYGAVVGLTVITGFTTAFDLFFEQKWITMFTIALGSIATFFSAGKKPFFYCKSNEI